MFGTTGEGISVRLVSLSVPCLWENPWCNALQISSPKPKIITKTFLTYTHGLGAIYPVSLVRQSNTSLSNNYSNKTQINIKSFIDSFRVFHTMNNSKDNSYQYEWIIFYSLNIYLINTQPCWERGRENELEKRTRRTCSENEF